MLRAVERWRARRRLGSEVGVWYHPDYASPILTETARVANLEPHRGELVLGRLMQDGLLSPSDVRTPILASMAQLLRFHPLAYLDSTLGPETLGRIFGLEPHFIRDPDELLRWARRQVGATIAAARLASKRPGFVAMNLGGGFHHAEPEQGSGFCVYNDIAVAIAVLRSEGYADPIAIVDLDFHQGNGNSVAFADDPTVLVYSLHGAVWTHLEATEHEIHLTETVTDRRYLAALRTTLRAALVRHRPSLVFYIAGNDVLAQDRLGSFWLSMEGVLQRDVWVADAVRDVDASLVVTLGGGYSRRAWLATYQFARYLLSGAARVEPARQVDVRSQFTRIARTIDTQDLVEEDDFELTEADVFGDLAGRAPERRILDFYSPQGVELAFERYGVLPELRKRGFADLSLEVEQAGEQPMLRLRGRRPPQEARHLLMELLVRRKWLSLPEAGLERLEGLFVEWLLLEDPTKSFTLERPPLPGQEHPGLGIAVFVQELLVQACRRIGLHGVFDRPAHYHNGLAGAEDVFFVDPEDEGRFRALTTVLAGLAPAEASHLVHDGAVHFADGEVVEWSAALHVLPVSGALLDYFSSEGYRRAVKRALTRDLERGLHIAGPAPIPVEGRP